MRPFLCSGFYKRNRPLKKAKSLNKLDSLSLETEYYNLNEAPALEKSIFKMYLG
jgi:hypothetical protein